MSECLSSSTMTMDVKSEPPKGTNSVSVAGGGGPGPGQGAGQGGARTIGSSAAAVAVGGAGGPPIGPGGNVASISITGVTSTTAGSQHHDCAGCKKKISERYMLKALDLYWHEDCLKCACCDCRLGEVGSTLFTKANLILCKRDYLRLFGTTGYCSACSKMIPAFEMVMRARGNVYHLECFACQQCNHRFCVGDRFYLCDSKILCEYDYEERMVFANMPYNFNSIAHIKRQTSNIHPATVVQDDGSSGYGSPDSLTFDGK